MMVKRKMSEKELAEQQQFFGYLNDFYGKNGTYPNVLPDLTLDEVVTFIDWAKSKKAYVIPWSGGDSTDRERARDFILMTRKKAPTGYILSPDKFEYGLQDILLHFRWRIVSPEQYEQLEELEVLKKKRSYLEMSEIC